VDSDEQLDLDHLAGLGVDDVRLLAGVVDEHLLASTVELAHKEPARLEPATVDVTELRVAIAGGVLLEAAAQLHERPDGRWVRLSARTIEAWHYAYVGGGFDALFPEVRSDRGSSRVIRPEAADLIVRAKRERPRRSVRRIIRMLERAGVVRRGELERSTVHRLLKAHGISDRPRRGAAAERRSFIVEHTGDPWMGDALHPRQPVIAPDGQLRKAYLLSQIDVATRFVPHRFVALSEGAVDHEHGLKEALLKHGRPRVYYVDGGAAYKATSLRLICAELGIQHLHTPPGEGEAKGAIEKWHRTWREEVEDELPGEPLPLWASRRGFAQCELLLPTSTFQAGSEDGGRFN